jgi:hypothetical protein
MKKDFAPIFVKNERFSATLFSTVTNSDHFFQSELSDFADTLFFKDQMNLFEVYNGLVKANAQNPSLGLNSAIKHLEGTYSDILRRNDQYREIEGAINESLVSGAAKRQIGGI